MSIQAAPGADTSPPLHQAPRRAIPLLAALAAGPAAWALQLIGGYGFAGAVCFPRNAPQLTSPPPGWSSEPAILLALNLACLACALGGFAVAFTTWRRVRGVATQGRSRFLAACGAWSCAGFAIAILFDTAPILSVPACWSVAS